MSSHSNSSSSEEEVIILGAVALVLAESERKPKRKVRRTLWTKNWIRRRNERSGRGGLALIHNELRVEDKTAYKNYLRMDEECFFLLLQKIEQDITYTDTRLRKCISARDRLTIALRFLATGESYQSLSYQFRVGRTTIGEIVPEVLDAICNNLRNEYMKVPTTENEWIEVEKGFREKWNFANCCGSIDGKHITFLPFRSDGSFYRNYKGTDSIVLLAIADANYNFLCIDVGANGRVSDGGVFRNSIMSSYIHENHLNIPDNVKLPDTNIITPFVFVADDAFPLTTRIMKPFRYHGLSKEQKIYNYRVSRARRVVENAFGILANRFRVLLNPMKLNVEKVEKIIIASCILHNFLIKHRGQHYIEAEEERDLKKLRGIDKTLHAGNRSTHSAIKLRNTFVQYFNTAGQVPWQDTYITNK